MSGGELCSIARITGKEESDCSLLSLHIQGFFISASGQNSRCFPNVLTTGSFPSFFDSFALSICTKSQKVYPI